MPGPLDRRAPLLPGLRCCGHVRCRKILVVGGGSPTNTAERIDLTGTGTWTPSGNLSAPRRQMNATLLADGTVLVTGGSNAAGFNTAPTSSAVLAAELWNPARPTEWKVLASMTHNRLYHSTAILLPDARVLSTRQRATRGLGLSDDYTGQIFSPPTLSSTWIWRTPRLRPVMTMPRPPSATVRRSPCRPPTREYTKVTSVRLSAVTSSTPSESANEDAEFLVGKRQPTIRRSPKRQTGAAGALTCCLL